MVVGYEELDNGGRRRARDWRLRRGVCRGPRSVGALRERREVQRHRPVLLLGQERQVTAAHVHGLMADLLAFRKRQAAPFEERVSPVKAIMNGEAALRDANVAPLQNGFYVASCNPSAAAALLAEMSGMTFTGSGALPAVGPEDIGLDPRRFRVRPVAVVGRTIVCEVESLLN